MGWGFHGDFIFDANRTQYWRWIYRVQPVVNLGIFDWIVGIFRSTPRHIISSVILRHCWFNWDVALVLKLSTSFHQQMWYNYLTPHNKPTTKTSPGQTQVAAQPIGFASSRWHITCSAATHYPDLYFERLLPHQQITLLSRAGLLFL